MNNFSYSYYKQSPIPCQHKYEIYFMFLDWMQSWQYTKCYRERVIMLSDIPIREPKQKRSIEKKNRIIQAGFEVFCEKGYYNTNTIEIAQAAGVSTGTVYSYFRDKKDIFLAAFEDYLNTHYQPLADELANTPKPIDIKAFIDKCIDLYIKLYITSQKTVAELGKMQEIDPEIMNHFAVYEDMLYSSIVRVFDSPDISIQNLKEKIYILYTFAEIMGQEHAFGYHKSINLDILREEVTNMLVNMLTSPESPKKSR